MCTKALLLKGKLIEFIIKEGYTVHSLYVLTKSMETDPPPPTNNDDSTETDMPQM